MAIISCLKYYVYTGDTSYLNMAKTTGNYLVQQDLTPLTGFYPGFPYAVGSTGNINPNGSGHPTSNLTINPAGHIQTDKGAMDGVALLELYKATGLTTYSQYCNQHCQLLIRKCSQRHCNKFSLADESDRE